MTEQQIDRERLRKLADAAARGPWEVDDGGGYDFSVTQGPDGDYIACDVTPRDAEFIAAARTAIPQILDLLDQAEAELDSWMARAYEAEGKLWKAEARIKRLENRAASETARADAWREKHRVMARKRDVAHRAWFEEYRARRALEG